MVAPTIVVMPTVVTLAVNVPALTMPGGDLVHRSCLRRCLPWPPCQTDAIQPGIYMIFFR